MDLEFAIKTDVVELAVFFGLVRLQTDLKELSLIVVVAFDTMIVLMLT